MRKVTPKIRDSIRALKRQGLTLREVGRRLELSPETCRGALADLDGPVVYIADTDEEQAEWALDAARRDYPEFARWCDDGASVVDAAMSAEVPLDPWLLRSSEALAEIALVATEFPGDDADAPKGEGQAERDRAIALLQGALAIVRKRGIAPRWRKSTRKARA